MKWTHTAVFCVVAFSGAMGCFVTPTSNESNLTEADLAAFGKALEADPDLAEAHNNIAIVTTQMGDLEKAEHHFRKAIEIRPHFGAAYGGLGEALAQQKRTKEAGRYTAIARRLRPDLFEKPGGAK